MEEARLTRSQVARRLGISAERVRQLSTSGRLPFIATPLGRLYDATQVEELAARRASDALTRTKAAN